MQFSMQFSMQFLSSQLSEEDLRKGGILPELIRLSIGLEHIDDILAALDEALASI